jgi:hypothetical protein
VTEPQVVVPSYALLVACMACNREIGEHACDLCAKIEYAERSVTGTVSPQLREVVRSKPGGS